MYAYLSDERNLDFLTEIADFGGKWQWLKISTLDKRVGRSYRK